MISTRIFKTKAETAKAAAKSAAEAVAAAIKARGHANVVMATGASQFEFLAELLKHGEVDWSKTTCFHLDEYIGMSESHPASFRRYLKERFISKVPNLGEFHLINGEAPNIEAEIARVGKLLDAHPIDVMFAGIGENGHLAFNDPPADFKTIAAYKIVDLDERCRRQQLGEGWFATFDDVPKRAVSMTIQRIMSSRVVILTVPDVRKAEAVQHVLEGPVTNLWPSSILQDHADCRLFLDEPAASKLSKATVAAAS